MAEFLCCPPETIITLLIDYKAMAPHSSTLAWKIPWTEEPSDHGVTKSWTRLSDFTFMHWRRKWQPIPVFFPGESQGRGSLVGCHLWGHIESDMTERLHFNFSLSCTGEGNGNHSSILAWRIPGTGEPGGLPSVGSHRVGHD